MEHTVDTKEQQQKKKKNNVKLRYCCFQKLSEKKRLENQNKPKNLRHCFSTH